VFYYRKKRLRKSEAKDALKKGEEIMQTSASARKGLLLKKKSFGRSDYYIPHYCLLFSVTFPHLSTTVGSTVPT